VKLVEQVAVPLPTFTLTWTVKYGVGLPTPNVMVAAPVSLVYAVSIEVVVSYFLVIFTGASGTFDDTVMVSWALPAGLGFDTEALQKCPDGPTWVVVEVGDVDVVGREVDVVGREVEVVGRDVDVAGRDVDGTVLVCGDVLVGLLPPGVDP
jgi:hypothetical protein